MRARRAAGQLAHQVELAPRPAGVGKRLHDLALHLAFDRRRIEQRLGPAVSCVACRIARTLDTLDCDRIHVVRAEAERPQQPGGCDLSVHFTVRLAVFHLQFVARGDLAGEFRRMAPGFMVDVRARNGAVAGETFLVRRTRYDVHRRNHCRPPDLRAADGRQPGLFAQAAQRMC